MPRLNSKTSNSIPTNTTNYSSWVYIILPYNKVHLFKYFLEAQDNLGLMSVIDRWRAVVKVRFTKDQSNEFDFFIQQTQKVLGFTVVPRPKILLDLE